MFDLRNLHQLEVNETVLGVHMRSVVKGPLISVVNRYIVYKGV